MIRYSLTTPTDELEDGRAAATVSVTIATSDPDQSLAMTFEGDPELVRRVQAHLRWSSGVRGRSMDGEHASPRDLVHAVEVSRQLDDYNPERVEDTVDWDKEP